MSQAFLQKQTVSVEGRVANGTITITSDTNTFTLSDLGFTPSRFFMALKPTAPLQYSCLSVYVDGVNNLGLYIQQDSARAMSLESFSIGDNSISVTPVSYMNKFNTGNKYDWWAVE